MVEEIAYFIAFVLWLIGMVAVIVFALKIMANKRLLNQSSRLPAPEPKILPSKSFEVEDSFQSAPTLHPLINGEAIWRPTPTIGSGSLTKQHIAVRIKCLNTVEPGSSVGVRVDVSNNHPSTSLKDEAILVFKMPTGVQRFFGPNTLELRPNGEMFSVFYIIEAPFIKGNYFIEFRLLGIGLVVGKVLVVK